MGLLTHLFYPWGLFIQIIALVHFFRRRPEWYWLLIIFLGGFIGAAVYIVAEVAPDLRLIRDAFQSHGRKSRIAIVETAIVDNPSVANLEELGELYWDEKDYVRARDAFSRAIATQSDSPQSFYRRGVCSLELGDAAAAVPDLEAAVRADPKMDSNRAEMFLAQAYAMVGRSDDAAVHFAEVVRYSNTPETIYSYAAFLSSQNRREDAREWLTQLFEKKRTLPRYMQRIERPWFNRGKALQKKLAA
jgi:hypothetical protein